MAVVWVIVGGAFLMSAVAGEGLEFVAFFVVAGVVYAIVAAAGEKTAAQNYEDAMSCVPEPAEGESDAAHKMRCEAHREKAAADGRRATENSGKVAGAVAFAFLAAPWLAILGLLGAAVAAAKRLRA